MSKKLAAFVLLLCLCLTMALPVSAAGNETQTQRLTEYRAEKTTAAGGTYRVCRVALLTGWATVQMFPTMPGAPWSDPMAIAAGEQLLPQPGASSGVPMEVQRTLAGMDLYEKVCQMFMVQPADITGVSGVTVAGDATRAALEKHPVGGLMYDTTNMVDKNQVLTMATTTQTYVKIPLLLACDEEGGRVARLMVTVGTTRVGPMLSYKDAGVEMARINAATIAGDMVSCGLNMDLAPVADVWSNPQNTVIGDRAYSDEFYQASLLIPKAVEGFHEGGVACTLKHFPGHGDTSADSHYGSVYVYKPLDRLRAEEFLPFAAGIDAGADAVMLGHIILGELGDEPVLFSGTMVTDVLRGELGFDGVVMTDSLKMQAMSDHYTSGEIAVRSVSAGVDLLLCPADLDGAIQALLDAVASGELTEERIDESVTRILTMKYNMGLL